MYGTLECQFANIAELTDMSEKKEIQFEEALQRLEQIVGQLENGQLSLEESMKAFEEGMKLRRLCEEKLDAADKKIEKLVAKSDGTREWSEVTGSEQ